MKCFYKNGKRCSSTILATVVALSVPTFAFAYDFSKIDCNAPKTRQMLIDDYNELLKDDQEAISVIDAYNQINEIREKISSNAWERMNSQMEVRLGLDISYI